MVLSKRLAKIADCMEYARCVADIGTDHAYLPIGLIKMGKATKVIAMDIRTKPLERAKNNITQEGLDSQIILRLSDGADKLEQNEADVVCISGMGGGLMTKIISDKPQVFRNLREMYLSPQSEVDEFRYNLMKMGYRIIEEWMVFDDGKYYFIIKASYGDEDIPYSECELRYGRSLLNKKDSILLDYLNKEKAISKRVQEKLKAAGTRPAMERIKQVEYDLKIINEAESYFI